MEDTPPWIASSRNAATAGPAWWPRARFAKKALATLILPGTRRRVGARLMRKRTRKWLVGAKLPTFNRTGNSAGGLPANFTEAVGPNVMLRVHSIDDPSERGELWMDTYDAIVGHIACDDNFAGQSFLTF